MFEFVNESWGKLTKQMQADPNSFRATEIPNVVETLREMDGTLTKIQKSLDQYLEKKRQAFPRFYFLSAEDLLEILGQSRDPNAVQKHLKKCFEAIHRLRIEERVEQRLSFDDSPCQDSLLSS